MFIILQLFFATPIVLKIGEYLVNKPLQVAGRLTENAVGQFKGAFVWDQSGIRIIGIMRVSVCLGAILIPEYLDFHSGYSALRSRIAQIYSGIYSYSGISQTNAP